MQQPNILLCTIDSLRADYVYRDIAETPTLDTLAAEGAAYKNAFAQGPFTTFSMPSLFTSQYPSQLSYVTFSEDTVGVAIEDEPTITTLLADAGYETAGFHSNPLLSNLFGFDRGFDVFDANLPFSNTEWMPGRAKILADKVARILRKHAYVPAETLTNRVLKWLDERRNDPQPFFLWVHYMDVHGPYQAKSGFSYLNKYQGEKLWRKAITSPEEVTEDERDKLQSLYQTEIEYTDKCLGTLLSGLRKRGLADETLTTVTADHGEQFFEHGKYSHPHQLYDELLHVPLIVNGPEQPDKSDEAVVELTDVTPTLATIAGINIPDKMAGSPLDRHESNIAISEANLDPAYTGSVRTDRWKYIRDEDRDEEVLFDLENDPNEQTDVSDRSTDILQDLAARLDDHQATHAVDTDTETIDVSATVEDQLEDLGYF